jgi:ABC-type lipoprotein export system ATPase subunit
MTINRGSEWRKWDLHVHTPLSIYQKFGNNDEETWEKYISDLENLSNDFAVVGINDYLFLDGYAKLKKEQENNFRLSNLKLLPVVEFRIEKFAGINFEKLKRINLHVIFSDEIPLETIQSQFLNTLEQSYYLESGEPWTRAITTQSVEELGNQIKSNVPKSELHKYGSDLTEGFNNLNVREEEIFKSLNKDCFTGKYLIAIGKTEWGDLKWTDASIATKKSIINKANIVFTASESIDDFDKAKAQLTSQCVNDLLLDCSDAHYLSTETDKDRIGNCNTWIKAQPTFEGLKQIIYEPEERVKIQNEMPEAEKLDNLIIEKVTFTSSENRFTPEPIYFNKNLNVIIGGKSSGKSILLYEIAKTLYADSSDEVLQYKDVTDGNIKDLYNLNEISKDKKDETYNFKVDLFSGSSQNLKDRSSNSSILPSIKYIPQNHLSNLVDRSRKNGGTLKKLIRNLILEEDEYQLKYDEFVKQAKRNDEQREKDIDYYFTLENELTKKEAELQTKGDTKALKEGIEHNKHKITQLNKDFSENEQTEYTAFVEKLNAIKIQENNINSDYEKLDGFQSELKRTLIELANKKKIVLDTLQNERIKNEFTSKLQFLDDVVSSINEISTEFGKTEENKYIPTSLFTSTLKTILEDKEKIEQDLKPYNDKLENQKQVSAIQKSISEDEAKVAAIEQFIKEIETSKAAIITQKEKLFADFETNYQLYDKIIEDLKPRISNLQSGTDKIEIKPSVKYNFPKFRRLADNLFDNRGFNNNGFKYLYQYHSENPKSALSDVEISLVIQDLKEIFNKIVNNQLTPKGGNDKKSAIKKIFTDFFFDHWDVNSQDDDIHKMSTGKASFILLKLIIKLSKDNGPILIDQPEDNLDNRSVSKELVEFLKEKKKERQIILVTHNPNIVVNADAENIIVANQKGQNDIESTSDFHFDYINGALEDTFPKNNSTDLLKSMGIREHIAEIVEGGKEAFKKREEKYGF